jgi:hypothetical protein
MKNLTLWLKKIRFRQLIEIGGDSIAKGICASCNKEALVARVTNPKNNLSTLSCLNKDCIESAKLRVQYPPDDKRIREQLRIVVLSVCHFCSQMKTGVVAKPGEGAPCLKCDHNPNKNLTAELPELWF